MKKQVTWFGIIAAFIISFGTFFVGCNKDDMNDVIVYKGQVVYINTTTPFPDLTVKVTNGRDTHCQTQTDAGGLFSLKVRVNEIDGNYYLLAGDSTCVPKKVNLGGYGQAEVDLGVIEVEGPALPTVKTAPIQEENISADEAIIGGEVLTDGRLSVSARGICYGKNPDPTIDGLHTSEGSGLGAFTSTLKNLEYNTIYYARAYATNKKGTAYGDQVKFTTEEGVAIVVTDTIINITAHSAKCVGYVESDGGFPVVKRGTCWSKRPDPTIFDDCTDDGSGKGEFVSTIKDLIENTTYYVRTYATNSTKTTYGEQIIITTLDGLAVVQTDSITAITATGFTAYGTVVSDCDIPVTARGFCYSIEQYPTTEDATVSIGKGLGSYQGNIRNLQVGTTYYVRAFATNETETTYGEQIQVTTKDGLPVVETNEEATSTALIINAGGNVVDNGGFSVTDRGICWSATNTEPTITDKFVSGGKGNGSFSVALQELTPATKYYLRAYATNENGTSYGKVINVMTKDGLPIVSTVETTATSTTISSGGNITDDGGYNIITRGVCYSTTNSEPTIEDNYTTNGVGSGSFATIITNVTISTTYYVRAYATNSIGTGYGEVKIIPTGNGLPIVTTIAIGENITDTTAISGGQVTDDGGFVVTERGVCWSTLPFPTISDSKTSDGSGMGYFSSLITNIKLSNTATYYVRAYATNENGTSYGEQETITPEIWKYVNLPKVTYGAYTYKIYTDIGSMTQLQAQTECQNLDFAGYDDWFIPNPDELQYIMSVMTNGWYAANGGGTVTIWLYPYYYPNYSSSTPLPSSAYYWTSQNNTILYYKGVVKQSSNVSSNYYRYHIITPLTSTSITNAHVRPVRKYSTNQ